MNSNSKQKAREHRIAQKQFAASVRNGTTNYDRLQPHEKQEMMRKAHGFGK